ncbi:hypothetical protein F511_32381 [Dorcoceras hygrometricum]|uniref:Uncharacterized protein n=1 Tax=Dorcoceras hygrometricum TaxID=472368 RepID=A0A2Z7C432_9LAMI|nr:hypothetical protein F511_32381 [Dorcoceras hygrometricum]
MHEKRNNRSTGSATECVATLATRRIGEMRVRNHRSPSHPAPIRTLNPSTITTTKVPRTHSEHTAKTELRDLTLANNNLQEWYKMEELLKRSPMLPRTRKTTTENDGNCRRCATVNNALGYQQPSAGRTPQSINPNTPNDVVGHYLRLVLNQKLDNQTIGLNIAGISPKADVDFNLLSISDSSPS